MDGEDNLMAAGRALVAFIPSFHPTISCKHVHGREEYAPPEWFAQIVSPGQTIKGKGVITLWRSAEAVCAWAGGTARARYIQSSNLPGCVL